MSEQLQKRRLGRTGLEVTVFGFGCIKFPKISAKQAEEALERAIDLGVNFLDTARGYGDSEKKIGPVLKRRREEVYVATKTGNRTAKGAMKELETSLKNLQTDYLDLYQAHWVCNNEELDKVLGPGGTLETLRKAKEQGKIRHFGITMHRHRAAIRRAIESDLFETIMLAWNPLDEEGVDDLIALAHARDMGVIIMKPLSGGVLVSPKGDCRAPGREHGDTRHGKRGRGGAELPGDHHREFVRRRGAAAVVRDYRGDEEGTAVRAVVPGLRLLPAVHAGDRDPAGVPGALHAPAVCTSSIRAISGSWAGSCTTASPCPRMRAWSAGSACRAARPGSTYPRA